MALPPTEYMSGRLLSKILVLILFTKQAASDDHDFTYNGFQSANLSLKGSAQVFSNGLLQLTEMSKTKKGYAFHPTPLRLKHSSDGSVLSFATTFVFAMVGEYPDVSSNGLTFVLSPSKDLPYAAASQYLGLFNATNLGNESNHLVAVELDNNRTPEFDDIDNNHVGIDVNSLTSVNASPASYFSDQIGGFQNVRLLGGERRQLWIEYDGAEARLDVTLSPLGVPRPRVPLLSSVVNVSKIILDHTYVGFSASTGVIPTCHYVLGWSFKVNGQARALDLSQLPSFPRTGPREKPKILSVGLPAIGLTILLLTIWGVVFLLRRRFKYAELIEDWEAGYGAHRISYKELFLATKGFKASELLGIGGFGRVYKGTLSSSRADVAVKKVRRESSQGLREFIAEVVSIGRLRHRNIVNLLGYCRRRGELLLVYEYMQHGSLDNLLFDQPSSMLSWEQRLLIIKGIAAAVFYLHEGWEQVIVHRDIKSSNVLLDVEFNGRLGDFGLSRLYDHGDHPRTTRVVGTLGYIAPELARTSKASTSTDVFAFGVFLLEVACGRRPIEPRADSMKLTLLEWVLECWRMGAILEAVDPNLNYDYVAEEVEMVLKLGLLCCNCVPAARPPMRQVMQFLDGDAPLPALSPEDVSEGVIALWKDEGFDQFVVSYPSLDKLYCSLRLLQLQITGYS
ncbi:hypothetical protein Taro_011692 [Colocasia esculenta]|uniref:non-specific serine/threonine protein kinase n=1 Tax=Colocasia esculenta TaxID=4460 RepID=A0A843UGW2_COLES|nr:hypothetical protein [Colocasia esculenta]